MVEMLYGFVDVHLFVVVGTVLLLGRVELGEGDGLPGVFDALL
jgi:hypothetical protein